MNADTDASREIAASLRASVGIEAYRAALARITPLVGASFASVFLGDESEPELLRLACAQNWPQSSARFLGEIRIRRGRGPTGRAVAMGEPVEVRDVFLDPALEEWWEPARELGFVSMTALPIPGPDGAVGALSFYFSDPAGFDRSRPLLHAVARHLAS